MKFNSTILRKWSRTLHRDISFFFSGMVMIYAISGIVMNHRDAINPHYSVSVREFTLSQPLPTKDEITKERVLEWLQPLDEASNYTKHYSPKPHLVKVFLKGGSNLTIDIISGKATYERVKRKSMLSAMTKLHYNPGHWWTWFADIFAIGLILITITGIAMVKGNKGIWGRGGVELLAGIIIPLLFLFWPQ